MRYLSVCLALVTLAGFASANLQETLRSQLGQGGPDESLSVPGANPLYFCSNPDENILEIDNVDLDPNPPAAGKTLNISARGTLKQKVEAGAKVHIQVKYGLITLIKQDADLCEQVSNVDLECPIDEGETEIVKSVDLPREIPPGKYTVLADVTTRDGEKITCLTASIWFNKPGGGN